MDGPGTRRVSRRRLTPGLRPSRRRRQSQTTAHHIIVYRCTPRHRPHDVPVRATSPTTWFTGVRMAFHNVANTLTWPSSKGCASCAALADDASCHYHSGTGGSAAARLIFGSGGGGRGSGGNRSQRASPAAHDGGGGGGQEGQRRRAESSTTVGPGRQCLLRHPPHVRSLVS
jgi:hypothetical protein